MAEKKVPWWLYPEQIAEREHRRSMRRIGWGFFAFFVAVVGFGAWILFESFDGSPTVADQHPIDVPIEKFWTK
ncbi:MAG: hypothetical protein ACEQSB_04130 [Undibacterium sp.]